MWPHKETIKVAKLNRNKKIVEYAVCSSKRYAYDPKVFQYIGKGVIYTIDGVHQTMNQIYHFWERRNIN